MLSVVLALLSHSDFATTFSSCISMYKYDQVRFAQALPQFINIMIPGPDVGLLVVGNT